MGAHHCHAEGCSVEVPPKLLMCGRHWKMVTRALQALVWVEYRPGQEITKDPSKAYLRAAKAAIDSVAKLEGRRETVWYHGLEAPRWQKCAFCKREYDAAKDALRPHAVCWGCWASPGGILDIEIARRQPELPL